MPIIYKYTALGLEIFERLWYLYLVYFYGVLIFIVLNKTL